MQIKGHDISKTSGCPYSGKCGGCSYTGLPYAEQLKKKQALVESLLKKSADEDKCVIEHIVGADDPLYYRNKVHAVFSKDRRGNVICGMYREDSHDVVDIEGCMLEDKTAGEIIKEVKRLANVYKMKVFNEDTGYGFLRHALVRSAVYHGKKEYMLILVTADVMFQGKNNFIRLLRAKFPQISTIVQNINNRKTSLVLGERNIPIFGKGFVVDDSLGFEFRISPAAFFQINREQTKKLYELALEAASPAQEDKIIDAYCGTGTIGMFMSRHAGHVTGVELNKDAVADALSNIKRNKIDNMDFICADATAYLQEITANAKIDILCMDPPRSGSTEEFIKSCSDLEIGKIVYVSCNPHTLADDIKGFKKRGYRLKRIVPVDMFPQTEHVECVVLLEKAGKH